MITINEADNALKGLYLQTIENELNNSPYRKQETIFDIPLSSPDTVKRANPKIGRNAPCPCGSGKKYKKCCGGQNAKN